MPRTRGTVSERVVREVADDTGRDVLDLPPLYDAVDPDALDALVTGMNDGAATFTYAGRSVTVHPDASVSVADEPVGFDAVGVTSSGD